MARAASAVGGVRNGRGALGCAAVATGAFPSRTTIFDLFLVGLVAQRAGEDVAVDHRRRDIARLLHRRKARDVVRGVGASVASATVRRRGLRDLRSPRKEVVAREARQVGHALFVHGGLRVAVLAHCGLRFDVVGLRGAVALRASNARLVVRVVPNGHSDLLFARCAVHVARAAKFLRNDAVRHASLWAGKPLLCALPEPEVVAVGAARVLVYALRWHARAVDVGVAGPEAKLRIRLHTTMRAVARAGGDEQEGCDYGEQDQPLSRGSGGLSRSLVQGPLVRIRIGALLIGVQRSKPSAGIGVLQAAESWGCRSLENRTAGTSRLQKPCAVAGFACTLWSCVRRSSIPDYGCDRTCSCDDCARVRARIVAGCEQPTRR